jgi:hypothetical protein
MKVTIPPGGRWLALRPPLLALLLLTLSGLPLAACGRSVTHKSAAHLRLIIDISHYHFDDGSPHFSLDASLIDGDTGDSVDPPTGAYLTCNSLATWQCPEQPPGGEYVITYTDEHGVATAVSAPVPLDAFAILSPRSGGTAIIPTAGVLTIRFSSPTFPPEWTVAIDQASADCIVPGRSEECVVAADEQTAVLSPPAQAEGKIMSKTTSTTSANAARMVVATATATPPPTPAPTPICAPFELLAATPDPHFTPARSSVTHVFNGSASIVQLHGDFSHWAAGSCGYINLSLKAEAHLEPSGFQSVMVRETYGDTVHVSWVRG